MTEWALNLAFLALCFGAVIVNFAFGPVDKPVRIRPPPPPQKRTGEQHDR